jgi:hypothetical protein
VTEQFAAAPDLQSAVAAAIRGAREATGARAAVLVLRPGHHGRRHEEDAPGAEPSRRTPAALDRGGGRRPADPAAWAGPGS